MLVCAQSIDSLTHVVHRSVARLCVQFSGSAFSILNSRVYRIECVSISIVYNNIQSHTETDDDFVNGLKMKLMECSIRYTMAYKCVCSRYAVCASYVRDR